MYVWGRIGRTGGRRRRKERIQHKKQKTHTSMWGNKRRASGSWLVTASLLDGLCDKPRSSHVPKRYTQARTHALAWVVRCLSDMDEELEKQHRHQVRLECEASAQLWNLCVRMQLAASQAGWALRGIFEGMQVDCHLPDKAAALWFASPMSQHQSPIPSSKNILRASPSYKS